MAMTPEELAELRRLQQMSAEDAAQATRGIPKGPARSVVKRGLPQAWQPNWFERVGGVEPPKRGSTKGVYRSKSLGEGLLGLAESFREEATAPISPRKGTVVEATARPTSLTPASVQPKGPSLGSSSVLSPFSPGVGLASDGLIGAYKAPVESAPGPLPQRAPRQVPAVDTAPQDQKALADWKAFQEQSAENYSRMTGGLARGPSGKQYGQMGSAERLEGLARNPVDPFGGSDRRTRKAQGIREQEFRAGIQSQQAELAARLQKDRGTVLPEANSMEGKILLKQMDIDARKESGANARLVAAAKNATEREKAISKSIADAQKQAVARAEKAVEAFAKSPAGGYDTPEAQEAARKAAQDQFMKEEMEFMKINNPQAYAMWLRQMQRK